MKFDANARETTHYVLVLDYLKRYREFVIAEPYPWPGTGQNVYCVKEKQFAKAWRAAKRWPPWAAALCEAR
jgi:hypothetical protein